MPRIQQELHTTKICITDPCWVDGVERQRKGHQDQFAAQHLQNPLLLQMSLNKCWPTETPSGHVLYGSEGWWKYVGLIWWQIQQHCTPSPLWRTTIPHTPLTSNFTAKITSNCNSWRFCSTSGEQLKKWLFTKIISKSFHVAFFPRRPKQTQNYFCF